MVARSHRLSPDLSTAERGRGIRMRNVTLPVAAAVLFGFLVAPTPIAGGGRASGIHVVHRWSRQRRPIRPAPRSRSRGYPRLRPRSAARPHRGAVRRAPARPRPRQPAGPRGRLRSFYAGRDHAPVWVEDGRFSPKARRAIFRLARADADGLDASRYRTASLDIGVTGRATPQDLARAEFELTLAVARLRPPGPGRSSSSRPRSGKFVSRRAGTPAAGRCPCRARRGGRSRRRTRRLQPAASRFQALRGKLAGCAPPGRACRRSRSADGPSMKPGLRDARVPALRERLGLAAVGGEAAIPL